MRRCEKWIFSITLNGLANKKLFVSLNSLSMWFALSIRWSAQMKMMTMKKKNSTKRCEAPLKLVLWSVCVRVSDHLTRECNNNHKIRRFMSMCKVFSAIHTKPTAHDRTCLMSCTESVSCNQHSTTNAIVQSKNQRQLNGFPLKNLFKFFGSELFSPWNYTRSTKNHHTRTPLQIFSIWQLASRSFELFKCTFQFENKR